MERERLILNRSYYISAINMRAATFVLGLMLLVTVNAQRFKFGYRRHPFIPPFPRMYNIGGYPGYLGRWVMRFGGAGPGELYSDGEGPPGTRAYHASHGHFHGH